MKWDSRFSSEWVSLLKTGMFRPLQAGLSFTEAFKRRLRAEAWASGD